MQRQFLRPCTCPLRLRNSDVFARNTPPISACSSRAPASRACSRRVRKKVHHEPPKTRGGNPSKSGISEWPSEIPMPEQESARSRRWPEPYQKLQLSCLRMRGNVRYAEIGLVFGKIQENGGRVHFADRLTSAGTYYLFRNTWFSPAYGASGVYYRVVPTDYLEYSGCCSESIGSDWGEF